MEFRLSLAQSVGRGGRRCDKNIIFLQRDPKVRFALELLTLENFLISIIRSVGLELGQNCDE